MKIELEYKIIFDPEDGNTTPISACDGRVVSDIQDIEKSL